MSMFAPATKTRAKLRLALAGPAGSGKTYTALALASVIADGGKVALIDTENGSASKYADLFAFDAADLTVRSGFSPEKYLELLHGAEAEGYAVIVIDSLSHEWAGQDGILQSVDQAAAQTSGNKFVAWGKVTPRHDKLVRAIVESPAHIICTLRAKMEYVQEKNDRGRTEIRAVGMKPIQRDELEYEFDVYGLLDQDNRLIVRKSRCPSLSGAVIEKPGQDVGAALMTWLNNGTEAPAPAFEPARPDAPLDVGTPAVDPGTQASRAAATPSTSPAVRSSSSTTTTPVPSVPASGDAKQRWARLVNEAERVKLPTLGQVKAIDPQSVPEAQLTRYADRLEENLYQLRETAGAA